MNKQSKSLSPYWQKITGAAETIMQRRIEDLERRTVDPSLCLVERDIKTMTYRQWDLEGMKEALALIRQGGFWGKCMALDAVSAEKPGLIFGCR